ncbi:MAG: hypothetical protein GTN36_03940 [Candidatus Aenigmarchaeota archaeon]|nr:hypothetical protein [Candidatus Aenigmarchaeota archaeon]
MCKQYKIPIYSLLTGIIITLITALFPNVFLVGVSHWGYLLPWLRRVVYPGAAFEVLWVYFLSDIVIWSVLIYLALISVKEEKKKPVIKKPKKKTIKKKRRKR